LRPAGGAHSDEYQYEFMHTAVAIVTSGAAAASRLKAGCGQDWPPSKFLVR
jgi:hypothetical protein